MSTSVDALVLVLAVAVGGSAGAVVRYLCETWAVASWGDSWPWGTFAVNVTGSMVLGAVVGASVTSDLPQWASLLVATGFCGALTTFSSFSLQVLDLSRQPPHDLPAAEQADAKVAAPRFSPRGLAYAAVSLGAGLLAALLVPALTGVLSA